jgi:hypothetical protein
MTPENVSVAVPNVMLPGEVRPLNDGCARPTFNVTVVGSEVTAPSVA